MRRRLRKEEASAMSPTKNPRPLHKRYDFLTWKEGTNNNQPPSNAFPRALRCAILWGPWQEKACPEGGWCLFLSFQFRKLGLALGVRFCISFYLSFRWYSSSDPLFIKTFN